MFETTAPKVNNFMHSFLSDEDETYYNYHTSTKVNCTLCNKTTKLVPYEGSAWVKVGNEHGNC
jgi:hypothetical protein